MVKSSESSGKFCYNIKQRIKIRSDVRLSELEYFRTQKVSSPDLIIQVSSRLKQHGQPNVKIDGKMLTYQQGISPVNSSFSIFMSDPLEVSISALLASSPHVLYVNLVEPLLRFIFASKGLLLLHSACIKLSGRGVILSSKTDTGKTSTILKIMSRERTPFLSDDMTIIDPAGVAYPFPKTLTVSFHTLKSINIKMNLLRKLFLIIRSSVHSRTGRKILKKLGKLPFNILTINSLAQMIIPPPKFGIKELIPDAEIPDQTKIHELFVLQRGLKKVITPLSRDQSVDILLKNNDDAYSTPPFNLWAPHLKIGSQTYAQLKEQERAILTKVLDGVERTLVQVPDMSWATLIPQLVRSRAEETLVEAAPDQSIMLPEGA